MITGKTTTKLGRCALPGFAVVATLACARSAMHRLSSRHDARAPLPRAPIAYITVDRANAAASAGGFIRVSATECGLR
jgi:hypothetical protein